MSAVKSYDIVVLGGGPGGYVAAIRAGQLGFRVAVIEKERVGGVCLNWGCIPSKALLKNSELYRGMKEADKWGISLSGLTFDFAKVIDKSRGVSDSIVKGVEFLLRKNKVETIGGNARFVSKSELEVETPQGKQRVTGKHIIIATGGRPRPLPNAPFDGKTIISSRDALDRRQFPKAILIIGAGAIGVEFASFYSAFGSQVTIIEMMPHIVPIEDNECSDALKKAFEKRGMKVLVNAKTTSLKARGDGVEAVVEVNGVSQTLAADCALVAIGVAPNTDGINLEATGVALDRGFVKVDAALKTNVPGLYAIGDVAGPPLLAHKASMEGIVCVERIAGHHSEVDYNNVPGCTYCQPQVASIGLTEQAARAKGLDYKVGKFPFTALGKAKAVGETEGFVKLLFDKKYGEILGAHIVGADATEMIAEIGLARTAEATQVELHRTIHAHPTFSEAIMEAAAAADGEAIHF